MPKKKKVSPPQIPENLLNVLNEHCAHGWILFSYDFNGNLRLHCNFDNEIVMKALRSDIQNWLNIMNELEHQIAMQSITGNSNNET